MTQLATGRRLIVAALTAGVSVGFAVALAAPAAAAPAGISFLSAIPTAATVGGTYTVQVRGDGATTPVELSTQDDTICSIAGPVVTFAGEGTCFVEAHQDADASHADADAGQLIDVDWAIGNSLQLEAPRISATSTSAVARNGRGWYRAPVTITFRCSAGSSPTTCPAPVVLTRSAGRQTVTRQALATDGGSAEITVGPVSVDRTSPALTVAGVRAGATYRGAGPKPRCVAHDSVSGVARCTVTTTRHGRRVTARATASDRAGNTVTRTVRYRVHTR